QNTTHELLRYPAATPIRYGGAFLNLAVATVSWIRSACVPCARAAGAMERAAASRSRTAQARISRILMGSLRRSGDGSLVSSSVSLEHRVRRGGDDDDHALDDSLHIVVEAHDVHQVEGDEEHEDPGHGPADAAPAALEGGPAEDHGGERLELEAASGEGARHAGARQQREPPDRREEAG